MYSNSKRKGFIIVSSRGILPPSIIDEKRLGDESGCAVVSRTAHLVTFSVEFLGDMVVLSEIFYQSSISLRFLLALSSTRAEAFKYYKISTNSLCESYVRF